MKREIIDIHMHLIPGVDDGARDVEMAVVMLCSAKEQGVTGIIATPHSEAFDRLGMDGVMEKYGSLGDCMDRFFPDISCWMGCEIYCELDRMERIHDAIKRGKYPTMACTEYVLIEFSKWVSPENALACVETMASWPYRPIIAHMERYEHLRGNMELVDRLRKLGAMVQVNAYSLYDEMDASIRNWARQLVLEQKVTFLGSDAHSTHYRPPSVELGLNWLYENCDQTYADGIAWKNAKLLLLYRD